MYLASLLGEGNLEGRLDMVGVDNSLSPGLPGITVPSVELFSVVFGVDFGVVSDLIPEPSFLARFCRALPDFLWPDAGVLWTGPCGVVWVDWCGVRGCPESDRGLNGVGRLVLIDFCGAYWRACGPGGGW